MKRAVILDLDNCLAAADEVGRHLLEPAFDAIREASGGTLSGEALSEAFSDCWRHPLDRVAARHGFSPAMLAAGWKALSTIEVTTPMHGYGDLAELATLAALGVRLFLVTSGFRRLQESKIRALVLAPLFTATFVDAIDEPERKGKLGLFRLILERYRLAPGDVLVVGDSPESEIAAGNQLGIDTVQILRPGVPRTSAATFHVGSLAELRYLSRHA